MCLGESSVQAETQGPFHWKTFKGTMVSVVSVGEEAHLESTLLKSSPEYKHSCCSVGGKRVRSFSDASRGNISHRRRHQQMDETGVDCKNI